MQLFKTNKGTMTAEDIEFLRSVGEDIQVLAPAGQAPMPSFSLPQAPRSGLASEQRPSAPSGPVDIRKAARRGINDLPPTTDQVTIERIPFHGGQGISPRVDPMADQQLIRDLGDKYAGGTLPNLTGPAEQPQPRQIPEFREFPRDGLASEQGVGAPESLVEESSGKSGSGLLGKLGELLGPAQDDKSRERWLMLAAGLQGMSINKNEALQKLALSGVQDIRENRKSQGVANSTAKWLAANGREDLAELVNQNPLMAKTALEMYKGKESPSSVREYEYAKSQGYTGSYADFKKSTGGGTSVTVDMGPDSKETNKYIVKRAEGMIEAGDVARRSAAQLRQLEQLNPNTPGGLEAGIKLFAGRLGIELGDNVDNLQAMDAIINAMVPAQRPPGSGSMSDADLELFKRSLPQMMQSVQGRQLIIDNIKAIHAYDAERARIAEMMLYEDITPQEQRQMLKELDENTAPLKTMEMGTGNF